MSFNCATCGWKSAKFRCQACKQARYCSQKCQKEDWKKHKTECTFNYIKPQRKWATSAKTQTLPLGLINKFGINPDGTHDTISEHERPFHSIHSKIFNIDKFIQFLTACNQNILDDFAKIIYQILTGYAYTMNLLNDKIFPSELISSKSIKPKFEVFHREHTNPTYTLQNWSHYNSDPSLIFEKLQKHWINYGCIQCKRYLIQIKQKLKYMNCTNSKAINTKCMHIILPIHIGFNWNTFPFYSFHYIRDINIGAITITLTTYKSRYEREEVGYNNFMIATFKTNDILPYFNGIHYALLLKNILNHYEFDDVYYSRISRVGLSWSITHDINMRQEYIKYIRQLFHHKIAVSNDYFNKPKYSGASMDNHHIDGCSVM